MSFLFCDLDSEEYQVYLRRAAMGIRAADLLLALKVLTLQRQMDELFSVMSELDRAGADIGAISETHFDLTRQKFELESPAGRDKFRMGILKEMFKKELES